MGKYSSVPTKAAAQPLPGTQLHLRIQCRAYLLLLACIVTIVGVVLLVLWATNTVDFDPSSNTSTTGNVFTPPVYSSSSSSIPVGPNGFVYQVSPVSQPTMCLQATPHNNFTTSGFVVTLATCSNSEPAQFWQFTTSGGLAVNYVTDAFSYWFYLNANSACESNTEMIIAIGGATPVSNSMIFYNGGALQVCSGPGYYINPSTLLTTATTSYSWTLLGTYSPPVVDVVVGTTYTFESPYAVSINYPFGYGGAFHFTYGGIARNGTTFDPTYSSGVVYRPPSGTQYAYVQTGSDGSPGVTNYWMNSTVSGLSSGTASVSFWTAVRYSTGMPSNAQLYVFLGGVKVLGPTTLPVDGGGIGVWTQVTPPAVAVSGGTALLSFLVVNAVSGDTSMLFDSVLVSQ